MKYTPLKAIIQNFPKCDKDGNLIKEDKDKKPTSYLERKLNREHTFRLINGKPKAKLDRTKEVKKFVNVEVEEVEDLLVEKEYVVNCPLLKEKIKKQKKAIKCAFSFGNGFKVYLAYIYLNKTYNVLFMSMGNAFKSELIKEIVIDINNKASVKEYEVMISGVNKATAEELIEI